MFYVILYDITKDRLRGKIAKVLGNYGLQRIQYSAFLGNLKKHQLSSLQTKIQDLLHHKKPENEERKNVQIYPIPQYSWKNKQVIDNSHSTAEVKSVQKAEEKKGKTPELI